MLKQCLVNKGARADTTHGNDDKTSKAALSRCAVCGLRTPVLVAGLGRRDNQKTDTQCLDRRRQPHTGNLPQKVHRWGCCYASVVASCINNDNSKTHHGSSVPTNRLSTLHSNRRLTHAQSSLDQHSPPTTHFLTCAGEKYTPSAVRHRPSGPLRAVAATIC